MKKLIAALGRAAAGAMLLIVVAAASEAQTPAQAQSPKDPQELALKDSGAQQLTNTKPKVHRFWDRENILLFSGVGLARGLDYASTLNIRRRGINEIFLTNGIVDNHPLFASIEAAGTGASIGLSYIFHATGHHTLERWTSIVHIGVGIGGAGRNYLLKTPHAQ
ncbi:MAG TPA: hypothetical protein VLV89_01615 [Candidatus Acidoferrum sp.]|nr:hypothetical protein [Candidatus Acidoferrum sp.]